VKKGKYELRIDDNLEAVLKSIDCHKSSLNYPSYKSTMENLSEKYIALIKPIGYVLVDENTVPIRIQCFVTVGEAIETVINTCFETHNYLEAMMLNALADRILFGATHHLYELISTHYLEAQKFLSTRFEPGNSDVSMSVQGDIVDSMKREYALDINITEAYMISPMKSLAYYYEISDENCSFGIDHDCSACGAESCHQRKYIIRLHKENSMHIIQGIYGENLLKVLQRNHVILDAPCGGNKTCMKCKITAKAHGYTLSQEELERIPESEQKDVILACYHMVDRDLDIVLETPKEHIVETGFIEFDLKLPQIYTSDDGVKFGVGVDIGTTTVAVSLVNLSTRKVVGTKKKINPQKSYGADVISRIMYINENKSHTLGASIRSTIMTMTDELIVENQIVGNCIEEMVISGNTTMIYILLDIDPKELAVAPFKTVELNFEDYQSSQLFKSKSNFKVRILPWISAYVGGDIVSGLYATHMMDQTGNILLVDVGTNGEVALKTDNRIITAATAAGPAFEAANIKCGMGAVDGAICELQMDRDEFVIETIGDQEPIGICGSAIIDAIALLHKTQKIDDTGFMKQEVMVFDNIGIYPEDVRQVQLAKAAVSAGIEVLLLEAGLTISDIDILFLAGGFGSHIDINNSAYIGLIPEGILEKVIVCGNASLAGSVRYLFEQNSLHEIQCIMNKCEYLELSTSMEFNTRYVCNMSFGDLKIME